MSAPLKVIIMLVIWLLYSLIAYKGCLQQCCSADAASMTDLDSNAIDSGTLVRYPLDFQWANAAAFTNDGFPELKQRLLAQMKDNNLLQITGLYYEAEPKPDGYDNMGFARADAAKKLFAGTIPDDRVQLRARLMDETPGVRKGYFEGVAFEGITPEATAEASVEELDDRIIIRFPTGSVQREYDPAVEAYLTKLAERVKKTGERISLVGHTDNVGTDQVNNQLGLGRANQIKNTLTKVGVKAEQVDVDTKGKTQPVDSNNTETGRQNNRRVEVRLIKQ
ncbi:MAG: OmpA family protein [Saprospiraceae bacterium]|nr:OmpA family protein [Saprospiraceae bacterium]